MLPHEIDELAARQHGIITYRQLLDAGLSASTILRFRRRGLLIDIHRGVYRLAGSPMTWRQEVMAATAAGGLMTFAGHRTAAALHPFRRTRGGIIEVVTPRHQRLQGRPVRAHETKDLAPVDQSSIDGIPITAVNRTLIDVGRYWPSGRVGDLLDHAVRDGLTTYPAFEARVHALARRGRNGIGVARMVLADRGLDGEWGFEAAMSRAITRAGLPKPTRQWKVVVGAQDYYIDFAYPDARVGIECDSNEWHTLPSQVAADLVRQNHIVGENVLLLRYTSDRLRDSAREVTDEIAHHLRSRSFRL